jgi:hypothetical protein
MTSPLVGLHVRPAAPGDVASLCDLLNVIIGIGGTTALEQPLTKAQFNEYFLEGASCLSCLVAEAMVRFSSRLKRRRRLIGRSDAANARLSRTGVTPVASVLSIGSVCDIQSRPQGGRHRRRTL